VVAVAGAPAVKLACTLSPLAIVQPLIRVNVMLPVVGAAAVPTPAWKHVADVRSINDAVAALGATVNAAEGVTVTELLAELDKAPAAMKVTTYVLLEPWTVLVGVALTLLTPPDGVPMV
jgi:hypothetical protein